MSADPSSPHGVPVTSPSGGTASAANGLTSPLASPSEGVPVSNPSSVTGNGTLPATLPAATVPVVAIAGTGILLQGDYANGTGRANPHTIDHAVFAEAAATALNVPNLGTAALLDAPPARSNATPVQLVRGDDTRLGTGSSTPGPQGPLGASAYDLAVLNGFVGTQAQWLASLQGAPGPAGANGAGGDMLSSVYAVGAGQANAHPVDHAQYADLAGVVPYAAVTGKPTLGTASPLDVAASGNAASGQVVKGNDTRLSDARTPSSHSSSHAANGSDPVSIANTQVTGLGNASTLTAPAAGVNATSVQAVKGDDTRLSNARTPSAHAASHAAGGGDPLTLTKAQISDFPGVVGDMAKATYDANNDGVVDRALLADSASAVSYANVTGKPSTFAPSPHAASHGSGGADAVTVANTQVTGLGTASVKDVPSSGDASSSQVVYGTDSRLTNARTPTAHTHPLAQVTDAGTAASHDVAPSGNASAAQVVLGNDGRLSDSRVPLAHAATHAFGGSDAVTIVKTQVSDLGTIGTAAAKDIPASGNASTSQVVYGTDTRLSDARTPSAHAATHKSGGSDAIKLDELAAPTDVTTLNVSTSAHGLVPKANGVATNFLDGTGSWSTPAGTGSGGTGDMQQSVYAAGNGSSNTHTVDHAVYADTAPYSGITGTPTLGTAAAKDIPASGNASSTQVVYGSDTRLSDSRTPSAHAASHKSGGSDSIKLDELAATTDVTTLNASTSAHGLMPKGTASTTTFYRSDLTQAALPLNSTSAAGTVAQAPNSVYKFWRGDAAWQPQNSSQLTSASFVMPAVGSAVTVAMNTTAWPAVGMYVYAQDGTNRAFLEVTTVTSTTSIALTNRGHAINASSGTTFASGSLISLVGPAAATATQPGLVPTPPNDATKVLTGAMTYAAVAYSSVTGTPTLGTAAAKDVPASGDASSTQVVYGTDTRLTNARTPSAHASTHGNGGSDAVSIVKAQVSDLGTLGTAAALDIPASGNASSTQVVYGSDTRLGDSRTPTAHESTHITGGSDVIPAPTTSASGLVPTLPATGATSKFLNGAASFSQVDYSNLTGTPTLGTAAAKDIPASGNASSTQVVYGSDTRLSDGRTPTAHASTHASAGSDPVSIVKAQVSDLGAIGTAAAKNIPASGNASATEVVYGSDTRLSDSRTPTAHAASHASGGGDAVTIVKAQVSDLGTIGTAAAKDIPASGNASATQVVYGSDTRLTDARTPTSHAATHLTGGGDTIASATATAAGLVPTPPNSANKWYLGNSTWAFQAQSTETNGTFTVPAAGSTVAVTIVSASWPVVGQTLLITDGTRIGFFEITVVSSATSITVANRGYLGNSTSGTMATASTVRLMGPGIATATQPGFVPTPDNTATHFLNGQMAYTAVPYSSLSGTPSTFSPSAHASSHQSGGGDAIALDTLAATTDVTTLNASTGAHGLLPKLSGTASQFLNGSGAFAAVAYSGVTGTPTLGTSAAKDIPASGNASATQVVYGSDTRLSDSRSPSSHASTHQSGGSDAIALDTLAVPTDITTLNASTSVHGLMPKGTASTSTFYRSDLTQAAVAYAGVTGTPTLGTAAAKNIPASGNASATEVVYGSDTRLTDARTPASHAATHLTGGGDTIASATATAAGLVPTPPNNVNKWYKGDSTWSFLAQATETNGTFVVPAAGSTVAVTIVSASWPVVGQTVFITDGTRVGFFEVTVVSSATSVTVANRGYLGNSTSGTMATGSIVRLVGPGIATATQAGFVPTPDNTSTHFLNGQMGFTAPTYAGLGGTPPALDAVSAPTDITTLNASTSAHGLMPKGTASTTTFYRSDLTQAAVAYSGLSGTPSTFAPSAHETSHITGGSDLIPAPTTSATGLVPALPSTNGSLQVLNGAASFAYPAQTTATNGTFTVPAAGSTVAITIVSASWPVVGQTVFITDGTRVGYFEITVVTSATAITVSNRGYLGNSTSGTMATGSIVQLQAPGLATATQPGFVPVPPNNTTTFLNGQNAYTAVAYSSLSGTPSTFSPSAHASTHQSGGGDSIALDTLAVPTDITTLNASTSVHGLMPKGTASTTTFYRSDLTQATPPTVTRSAAGYAPASGGVSGTTNYLREDLTWAAPAGVGSAAEYTTNASFTCPAGGSTVSVTFLSTTGMAVGMGLYITTAGLFNVSSITNGTVAVLLNTGVTGNATSGTIATAQATYISGVATAATATLPGYVPTPPNTTATFLNGQASFATPPTVTTSAAGYAPTLSNVATQFLNGVGGYTAPPAPNNTALTTASFTMPAVGSSVSVAATNSANVPAWARVWVVGAGMMVQKSAPSGGNLTLINVGGTGNAASAATIPTAATVTVVDDHRESFYHTYRSHFADEASSNNIVIANSGTFSANQAAVDHPGVMQVGTGVLATGASFWENNSTQSVYFLSSTSRIAVRYVFILTSPLLVVTTQAGNVTLGLTNNNAFSGITQGMWIKWDPGVNSARWTLQSANGGSVTTVNHASAAPSVATWYEAILTFDGTTVNASIGPWNGTLVAFPAITTNLPTAAAVCLIYGIMKTAGTTASALQCDLVETAYVNSVTSGYLGASMLP